MTTRLIPVARRTILVATVTVMLVAVGGSAAHAANFQVPAGVSGTLVLSNRNGGDASPTPTEFGIVQRDASGNPTYIKLTLNYNTGSADGPFYRVPVTGGQVFEFYVRRNAQGLDSAMPQDVFSSDPARNTGIDPAHTEHLSQTSVGTNSWQFAFDIFNHTRDTSAMWSPYGDKAMYFAAAIQAACNNTTIPCGDPNIVRGGHWATRLDYAAVRSVFTVAAQGVATPTFTAAEGEGNNPKDAGTCGSRVDNYRWSFVHEALDWAANPSDAACACGGCGSTLDRGRSELKHLEIKRITRPKYEAYRSSFGAGGFSNYDARVDIYKTGLGNQPNVVFYDPETDTPPTTFYELSPSDGDNSLDGNYHDTEARLYKSLTLQDINTLPTGDPMAAAYVLVVKLNGERVWFEVIRTDATLPATHLSGRPYAMQDRNFNIMFAVYQFAANATDAAMNFDRTQLWKLSRVQDMHGVSATFTYEQTPFTNRWRVSQITLPTSGVVQYFYGGGTQDEDVLTQVVYPDGESSVFSKIFDSTNQTWIWHFDDVAMGPGQHMEDVAVTGTTYLASDGSLYSQAPGLVRKITNADGEQVYQNWEDPNDANTFYVLNGNDRLSRYRLSQSGAPLELARAQTVVADPIRATYVVDESYIVDATGHVTEIANGVGARRKFAVDPLSGQVTEFTRPDGAKVTLTLNSLGFPLRQVNEAGVITDFSYDSQGNALTMTEAVGTPQQALWQFTRNSRGQVTRIVSPSNQTSTYDYDATGNLIAITTPPDAAGGTANTRRFEYNANGTLVAEVDESGRRTTHTYDARGHRTQTTYPDLTTETATYGNGFSAGVVVQKKDRAGRITSFEYDSTRRLKSENKSFGADVRTRQFVYGRDLVAVETTNGERTEFTYDARERLTRRRVYANNTKTLDYQTAYDAADRPTRETDPYGRRTFSVYDSNGRLIRTVRELVVGGVPAGTNVATLARNTSANPPFVIEDMTYDSRSRLLTRTDGRGNVTTATYDVLGRRTKLVEASNTTLARTTNYTYDANGNQLTESLVGGLLDGTALTTAYTYSARNLVLSKTVASGTSVAATTSYTYTPTREVLTETNPRGGVTRYTYNSDDRPVSTQDPAGFVTQITYDAVGNRTSTRDPVGNTSSATYDGVDRKLSETNGAGDATTYQYDDNLTDGSGLDSTYASLISSLGFGANANGRAVLTTNAVGEKKLEVMDGLDRTLLVRDGNGNVSRVSFDTISSGLVATTTTNPLGKTVTEATDAAGQVRRTTDQDAKVSTRQFDAAGNVVNLRDANTVGKDCVYDALNRRTSCTDTNGSVVKWEYDRAGDVTAVVDPMLIRATCSYDARRRPTSCVDRTGATRRLAYDAASNTTSTTDGDGNVTTYAYDARNLRTTTTYPDAATDKITNTYDSAGRLSTVKDQSNNTITVGYDAANRETSFTYPDGTKDTLAYDRSSRVVSATSAKYGTVTSRTYDSASRLTQEVTTTGGRTFTVKFGFDAGDHLASVTYPDNSVVSRVFGINRDLVTEIKNGASSMARYAYDSGSRLTTETLGNAQTRTAAYRTDDLVSSITFGNTGTASYTYDAGKRRLTKTGTAVNGDQTFTYDKEDRLTAWAGPSLNQSWSLSNEADWKSTTRNGTVENRTHNAVHQIGTVGTKTLTHDPRGNLTLDDKGNKLSYDLFNRLLDYTTAAGTKVTYAYDAFGRKVARTVGTTTTNYVYAGADVIAEYNNGTLAIKYIPGIEVDRPIGYVRNGSTFWYVADELGSVLAVTNSSGAVVERYRYTAYGERTVLSPTGTVISASTVGNQLGFTGRPHDITTGIVDFRARHYDPRLGRFVSRDNQYNDGLSLYAAYFVPNSRDPSGHWGLPSLSDIGNAIVDTGKNVASHTKKLGLDFAANVEDLGKAAWRYVDNFEYGLKADGSVKVEFVYGTMNIDATVWAGLRYHTPVGSVGLAWEGQWSPIKDKKIFDGIAGGAVSNCPTNCCGLGYQNAEISGPIDTLSKAVNKAGSKVPGVSTRLKIFTTGCTIGLDIRMDVNILAYALPGSEVVNKVMKLIKAGELRAGAFAAGKVAFCYGLSSSTPIQEPNAPKVTVGFKEGSLRGGLFMRAGKFSADSPSTYSK
jgi:RHS repeat-associated protein